MFARVVIDRKNQNVDTLFDYLIPAQFEEVLCVGARVFVEFGFTKVLGYVVEIHDTSEFTGNIKPILEVLDFNDNLTKEQVELALFLKEETNALLISCFDQVLPSFLKGKYRKYLTVHSYQDMDANLAMLLKGREKVRMTDELMEHYPLIQKAIQKEQVALDYEYYIYGKQFYTKYYLIADKYKGLKEQDFISAKRYDIYKYVLQNEKVKTEDIQENVGASIHLIRDMAKIGILQEKSVLETTTDKSAKKKLIEKPYNFEEEALLDKYASFSKKPFLLHTNVDEFKIRFFVDQIIENKSQNKTVLLVVPNVFMVYQYAQIIKKRTSGLRIALFSSSIKPKEYYYQYVQAKNGNIDLIITTTVGIFTPLKNLGLIVLEEEESTQYLNESNPKFLTHEVLKMRMQFHQAKLVFVSKSPSLRTYHKTFLNEYYLLQYIKKPSSSVEVVDMKEAIMRGEKTFLSKRLEDALLDTVKNKKQALLVLNRTAYQTQVLCTKCHTILKCPKCKIALKFYKTKEEYKCDLCNYTAPETPVCEACHNTEFEHYGFGLEFLEQYLTKTYPDMRILNLHNNKFSTKEEYLQMLVDVEENKYDCILGQNLSLKVFSSNQIALVGMLDLSSLLYSSDFQAAEHAYQWMSTIVNLKHVTAILQNYQPLQEVIHFALASDYEAFYKKEMAFRTLLQYSPVIQMNRLLISGEFKKMYHFANYFKKVYMRVLEDPKEILGPVYQNKKDGIALTLKHDQPKEVMDLLKDVTERFKDEDVQISYEKYPLRF